MTLHLITAPTARPLMLPVVKAHLRVDGADEDAYLDSLIEDATARYDGRDGILGRALVNQTWELRIAEFSDSISIPLPPLLSIISIKYDDVDDVEQTLATTVYESVDGGAGKSFIRLKADQTWPSTYTWSDAVRIRYSAGYATASGAGLSGTIPRPIIQAMLLRIGDLYAHRESFVTGMTISDIKDYEVNLIAPYRVDWF